MSKYLLQGSAMLNIENITINIQRTHTKNVSNETLDSQSPVVVRDELVSTLRIMSEDPRLLGQQVLIPEGCEQYGFAEGSFDIPTLLHFLADMLE